MSDQGTTTTVVETTANATTEAMNRTVDGIKQAANAAAASMREGQARLTNRLERAVTTARQVVEFEREAVETFARAGRVYLDGMQTIGTGIAQAARKQIDETLETYRAMAGVKTIREGLELQNKLARTGASRFLTESATVAEQSAKLAQDVIAPITERVRTAAQKLAA
ncbi:MAG TPA: phasin family protein [Acidisphaera sp.]|nr:phasin family protein [Acidisphaera sp.]